MENIKILIPAAAASLALATGLGVGACGSTATHHAAAPATHSTTAPAAPNAATTTPTPPNIPPASTGPPPGAVHVRFVVTGTGEANITYGTDTSDLSGGGHLGTLGDANAVPWKASLKFDPTAQYYDLQAQLEGNGDIHCKIVITKPGYQNLIVAQGRGHRGQQHLRRADRAGQLQRPELAERVSAATHHENGTLMRAPVQQVRNGIVGKVTEVPFPESVPGVAAPASGGSVQRHASGAGERALGRACLLQFCFRPDTALWRPPGMADHRRAGCGAVTMSAPDPPGV
jgi:hypothetical protein